MVSFLIRFPSRQFLPTLKLFKSKPSYLKNLHLFSTSLSLSFRIQGLRIGILTRIPQPAFQNLTTFKSDACPLKYH